VFGFQRKNHFLQFICVTRFCFLLPHIWVNLFCFELPSSVLCCLDPVSTVAAGSSGSAPGQNPARAFVRSPHAPVLSSCSAPARVFFPRLDLNFRCPVEIPPKFSGLASFASLIFS
jgi:hypothetical protein